MRRATGFYGHVVGWSLKDFDKTPFRYVTGAAGDVPVVGMMTIPDQAKANGMTPNWVGYIGVADIDASCARLEAAGGRVDREPDNIPAVGRFAMVTDPQGAMFVLFTPENPETTSPTPA